MSIQVCEDSSFSQTFLVYLSNESLCGCQLHICYDQIVMNYDSLNPIEAHIDTFSTHHNFVILHLAVESICSQHHEWLGIFDQNMQPRMYLNTEQERDLTFGHTDL